MGTRNAGGRHHGTGVHEVRRGARGRPPDRRADNAGTGAEIGGPGVKRRDGIVDLPIPRGETTLLDETGTHLRLLDLQWQLQVLRSYPLDLIFEKGGTVRVSLSIDFPSAAS